MALKWSQMLEHPSFIELPHEKKEEVANRYFESRLAPTKTYRALKPEQQQATRARFMKTIGRPPVGAFASFANSYLNSFGPSIVSSYEELFGEFESAERRRAAAESERPSEGASGFIGSALGSATQTLPAIATGAGLAALGVSAPIAVPVGGAVALASFINFGLQSAGQARGIVYRENVERRKKGEDPVSTGEEIAMSVGFGASVFLAEKIGAGALMRSLRGLGTKSLKDAVIDGANPARLSGFGEKLIKKDIPGAARSFIEMAGIEGVEESFEGAVQNTLTKAFVDPEQEITEGLGESFLGGAIAGGALSLPFSILKNVKTPQMRREHSRATVEAVFGNTNPSILLLPQRAASLVDREARRAARVERARARVNVAPLVNEDNSEQITLEFVDAKAEHVFFRGPGDTTPYNRIVRGEDGIERVVTVDPAADPADPVDEQLTIDFQARTGTAWNITNTMKLHTAKIFGAIRLFELNGKSLANRKKYATEYFGAKDALAKLWIQANPSDVTGDGLEAYLIESGITTEPLVTETGITTQMNPIYVTTTTTNNPNNDAFSFIPMEEDRKQTPVDVIVEALRAEQRRVIADTRYRVKGKAERHRSAVRMLEQLTIEVLQDQWQKIPAGQKVKKEGEIVKVDFSKLLSQDSFTFHLKNKVSGMLHDAVTIENHGAPEQVINRVLTVLNLINTKLPVFSSMAKTIRIYGEEEWLKTFGDRVKTFGNANTYDQIINGESYISVVENRGATMVGYIDTVAHELKHLEDAFQARVAGETPVQFDRRLFSGPYRDQPGEIMARSAAEGILRSSVKRFPEGVLLYQEGTNSLQNPTMVERQRLLHPLITNGIFSNVHLSTGQLEIDGSKKNAAVNISTGELWLSQRIQYNTIGHEAAHRIIELLGPNDPVVQKGLALFDGNHETLSDAVGNYYAARQLDANVLQRLGLWLQELFARAKERLGLDLTREQIIQLLNSRMMGVASTKNRSVEADIATSKGWSVDRLRAQGFDWDDLEEFDIGDFIGPNDPFGGLPEPMTSTDTGFDFTPIVINPRFQEWMQNADESLFEDGDEFSIPKKDGGSYRIPKIFYHASTFDFTEFRDQTGVGDFANFFSPQADVAESIGVNFTPLTDPSDYYLEPNTNTMPVFINAKKVFDYENSEHVATIRKFYQGGYGAGTEVEFWQSVRDGHWGTIERELLPTIRQAGFDGFYVQELGAKNIAVFDPRNIKSIFNNGMFDPSNPDIRYQGKKVEGMPAEETPLDEETTAELKRLVNLRNINVGEDLKAAYRQIEEGAERTITRDPAAERAITELYTKLGFEGRERLRRRFKAGTGLNWKEQMVLVQHLSDQTFPALQAFVNAENSEERKKVLEEINRELITQDIAARGEAGLRLRHMKRQITPGTIFGWLKELPRKLTPAEMRRLQAMVASGEIFNPDIGLRFLAEIKDIKAKDIFWEFYYNSILSSPTTQLVNAANNAMWLSFNNFIHRPIAAAADRLLGSSIAQKIFPSLKGRERAYFFDAVIPAWAGMKEGAKAGARAAGHFWRDDAGYERYQSKWALDMGPSMRALETQGEIIEADRPGLGKMLQRVGKFISTPSRALFAADIFFRGMAFDSQLRVIAQREARVHGGDPRSIIANPTQEQIDEAAAYASYSTFMDRPGVVASALIKLRDNSPGEFVRALVPFINTLNNIVKRGMEMLPGMGLLMTRGQDPAEIVAKQLEGAVITALLVWMFDEDDLTGAPPVQEGSAQVDQFFRSGRIPYAIRMEHPIFGDRWISYRKVEPFNTVLSTVTALRQAIKKGEESEAGLTEMFSSAVYSVTHNLVNSTYTENIANLLERHGLERTVARFPASLVPYSGFLRSLNRATEAGVEEHGFELRQYQGFTSELAGVLPWAREEHLLKIVGEDGRERIKIDAFGEPATIPGNFLRQWLPIKFSDPSDDPVELELERLGIYPALPSKTLTIRGRKVELDENFYHDYALLYGRYSKAAIQQVLRAARYARTSDEGKARLIERRLRQVREKVRQLGRKAVLQQSARG